MRKNKLKLFFLVLGIICFVITVKLIINSIDYLNNSIRTKGIITGYRVEVVEKIEKERTKKTDFYYPKFQFKDQYNNVIEAESNVGKGGSIAYEEGSEVEVLYMEDDAQEAIINSFSNLWMGPVILVIFSFFFLAIGYYIPTVDHLLLTKKDNYESRYNRIKK